MKIDQKSLAIEINNFSIGYSNKNIFENISLSIPLGVRCAIIGLNGSGKTTLLKGILELEKKINGNILFFGKKLSESTNKIAYVPQIKTIDWDFPITVENVVKMGCYSINSIFSSTLASDWELQVHDALNKMNLLEKKNNLINNLSGGEKQRVFIARSIAQNPLLYILDEPLTGLDMLSEEIISKLFIDISNQNKTIIAVHHDLHTLYDYFNWVVIVNKGIVYAGVLDKLIVYSFIKEAFFRYS